MMFLKQSTAVDVMLGPFVDDTDGKTTEEALTLSQADLQLSKNGAAAAQKNDATAATHRYGGNYMVDLDATDTNTVGHLRLMCKETGALPVIADFTVLEEAIYDSLFAASAAGFDSNQRVNVGQWLSTAVTVSSTTSKPEVDINSISDDATAANNAELAFDGTGFGFTNCTIPTVTTLTGHTAQTGDTYALANGVTGFAAIDTVVDAIKVKTDYLPSATAGAAGGVFIAGSNAATSITTALTTDITGNLSGSVGSVTGAVGSVTAQVSADVTAISGSATAANNLEASALGIVTGACEGTPSTTVIQTDLAEATDDHYIGRVVVFTSGAAAGEATDITDYTGSTGTITVTALTTAPSAADTFVIV